MLFFIILAIGLAGFGYAAYLDLKTTEFPDWIPYAIILTSVASRAIFSFAINDYSFLINTLATGLLFLGFGLLLFVLRQWGDGDAWLLGALGFLLPDSTFIPIVPAAVSVPFPLTLLINFFLLSFAFIIVYSLALGVHHRIFPSFARSLRKDAASTSIVVIVFLAASYTLLSFALFLSLPLARPALFLPLAIIPLLLFLKYARFIESTLFRRRIPAAQLRPGDVPASERWRVLSPQQYRALKKSNRTIHIKEGVRLAPAFLLAFLATLFFGNLFALFLI